MMIFAFYLRKYDKLNIYSKNLLQGRIMPPILVDIIISNSWSEDKDCMVQDKNTFFRLLQGDGYSLNYSDDQLMPFLSKKKQQW